MQPGDLYYFHHPSPFPSSHSQPRRLEPIWLSISICTNTSHPGASDLLFHSIVELMVCPDGTWELAQYDWSSPYHQTGAHLFARAEDPGTRRGPSDRS